MLKSQNAKLEFNSSCDVQVVGFPVRLAPSSFALRNSVEHCSSILRDVIDNFTLEIINDGTLQRIKEVYVRVAQECDEGEEEESQELSLTDLGGIFILHYSVLILAVTLAVLALKYPRYFVSSLHEISVVRRTSNAIRVITSDLLANT